jgi:hypothetical protein
MRKGKVIIDFQEDNGECTWDVSQECENELENEDLVTLLEHVIRDLLPEDF